jgi:hypothetical protein
MFNNSVKSLFFVSFVQRISSLNKIGGDEKAIMKICLEISIPGQINPRTKFYKKHKFESKLRPSLIGTCMGNRIKYLFYSVLFNKFHRRINLNTLLFCNFLFLR